jgi:hypothetical protein
MTAKPLAPAGGPIRALTRSFAPSEPRTECRTVERQRTRLSESWRLNAAVRVTNGQWNSVSQMSQSKDCMSWHSGGGSHGFSPPDRLRRYCSAGFFIAAGREGSPRYEDQGRSTARKIQRIATITAIAKMATRSSLLAFPADQVIQWFSHGIFRIGRCC